jgi:hypothetical protein
VYGKTKMLAEGLRSGFVKGLGTTTVAGETVNHLNDYKLDGPDDSSATGTWNALRQGDFSGAGRSLSKGALEAGMDLGSAAANLADYAVPGTPVSAAYNSMLRGHFGDQLLDNSGNNAPATGQPQPRGAIALPPSNPIVAAPAAGAPTAGDPATQPLTSSGSQGLRDVSVIPDGRTHDQIMQGYADESKHMADMRTIQARADAAEGHAPGVSGINGLTLGGPASAARFRSEMRGSSIDDGLRSRDPRVRGAAMQTVAAMDQNAGQVNIANLREQGETTRATARNAAELNNATLRAGVETRGQDVGLQGHMYTADQTLRGNMARTKYDIYKDQRDNDQKMENQQYERTAGASKKLQGEFESTLPNVDGKPDTARAAQYANGLPAYVAARQRELEDAIAKNPKDTESAQRLAVLKEKGADAITTSATGKAHFLAGMQLAELANSTGTNGLTPWGTRPVQSNEPITSIRPDGRGNYVTNRRGVNGETEAIPARYIETEGGFMGVGGRANGKFNSLIER